MKMPTDSTTSLASPSSPAIAVAASPTSGTSTQSMQQSLSETGMLVPYFPSVRLESSLSFSLVFGTVIVGLVLVRHFIAKARSTTIDHLL